MLPEAGGTESSRSDWRRRKLHSEIVTDGWGGLLWREI
jgi:hypothetical protein